MWLRERLYFAHNARSRIPAAVSDTIKIYIKLMDSSVKGRGVLLAT
jgi:hypothetical protein